MAEFQVVFGATRGDFQVALKERSNQGWFPTSEVAFFPKGNECGAEQVWSNTAVLGGAGKKTFIKITFADSPYTASDKEVVIADATNGVIVVNIPTSIGNDELTYTIIKDKIDTSGNAVNVTGFGSETINGVNVAPLIDPGDAISIIADGANWKIYSTI